MKKKLIFAEILGYCERIKRINRSDTVGSTVSPVCLQQLTARKGRKGGRCYGRPSIFFVSVTSAAAGVLPTVRSGNVTQRDFTAAVVRH